MVIMINFIETIRHVAHVHCYKNIVSCRIIFVVSSFSITLLAAPPAQVREAYKTYISNQWLAEGRVLLYIGKTQKR